MPPAFVLSQDQTLMFNPSGPAIPSADRQPTDYRPGPRTDARTQSRATKRSGKIPPQPNTNRHRATAVPRRATDSPRAAARASLLPQQCQSTTPTATAPKAHTLRSLAVAGGRLYGPHPHTVNPLFSVLPPPRAAREPADRAAPAPCCASALSRPRPVAAHAPHRIGKVRPRRRRNTA